MTSIFVVVWEFLVRPGKELRFEEVYGPEGAWVRLFSQGQGYVRTELQRDARNPRRYMTLDFWRSREAYEGFRELHRHEYRTLDGQCQDLAERETEIGRFEQVEPDRE